jgi:hypothetical protein
MYAPQRELHTAEFGFRKCTYITIGVSIKTNSNCTLDDLDSFVSVVTLIESCNLGGEETRHYKK